MEESSFFSEELFAILSKYEYSKSYLLYLEQISRNSKLPGSNKEPQLENVQLTFYNKQRRQVLQALSQVDGYYFGESSRPTVQGQFVLVIVKYAKEKTIGAS